MAVATIPLGCLALLLALPVEGKWDFRRENEEKHKYIGCHILAVSDLAVMVTNHDNNNKVETYPFHHRLAQGWYNLLDSDAFSYSRADLKGGDRACLQILRKNCTRHTEWGCKSCSQFSRCSRWEQPSFRISEN